MKTTELFNDGGHCWLMLGRDADKPEKVIDTNQYVVRFNNEAVILDPGGIELFAPMLDSIVKLMPLEQVKYLFASHQDPDIISSLGLWDQVLENACLYSPWLWEGFIRHFGMERIRFMPIADPGGVLNLNGLELRFIPAHYLHSSGNFHVYDAKAKILFSGDIGAALEPVDSPMFVDDFTAHTAKMRYFHQRWMPSEQAKHDWIQRVRLLDIDMMCPQHGRIFRGEQVTQFLDWFEQLPVGQLNE
ncbi:MBL fold metallo-hydrolase [Rheinheimera baltica]|uniref:MBL fold metallo-hydrolase n=1 Tax=Rheinheimera baltica TaxID=67576 RepID=A0ABT9I3E0_9GAMM|nr:MBL fold metallo-hydrolase [Rheinheimera baltica]MDP5137905.1 MBL fold metallo-hydrolase [Rheinheimera baltica]